MVLAQLGPGACFGEISLLFNLQVTANVEAVTPVTFFALKPLDFKRFVEMFPNAGAHFVRLAEARMGSPTVDRRSISAEHHVVTADARMNFAERATFSTSSGYTRGRCFVCGYTEADIVCVSCGAVQ
jgi:CRP-like cAMP-binding protein